MSEYKKGDKVLWLQSGYGHIGAIPATVSSVSISGKRLSIFFNDKDSGAKIGRYVKPSSISKVPA